jgi:hypothetical protein
MRGPKVIAVTDICMLSIVSGEVSRRFEEFICLRVKGTGGQEIVVVGPGQGASLSHRTWPEAMACLYSLLQHTFVGIL